jgi:hypothetical protein
MKPYSEDLRLRIVQAVVKREIEALLDLDQLSEDRKQSAEERAEILGASRSCTPGPRGTTARLRKPMRSCLYRLSKICGWRPTRP